MYFHFIHSHSLSCFLQWYGGYIHANEQQKCIFTLYLNKVSSPEENTMEWKLTQLIFYFSSAISLETNVIY